MFGKNKIMKKVDDPDKLWVHSVFLTIQGEGPFSGTPALFVRMAGCNLQCKFCDTEFENSDAYYTQKELAKKIMSETSSSLVNLIVFTGGEPLRQNIAWLIEHLLDQGLEVQVETAGTLWWPSLDKSRAYFVISPKTKRISKELSEALAGGGLRVSWKYIIDNECELNDRGLPKDVAEPPKWEKVNNIYVQPCDTYKALLNKVNIQRCVDISISHGYRVSLQTHKIMGVE